MSNPMPSWSHRDLETLIKWLLDAGNKLADVENEIDLARGVRENVSDARTCVKGALMLAREIRSVQEELIINGETAQAAAHGETKAPRR